MKATFDWGSVGQFLWLIDQNGSRSLTNDMETALEYVAPRLRPGTTLNSYHIIYRDSEGVWDGVKLTRTGRVTFYFIGASTLEEAMDKVKNAD